MKLFMLILRSISCMNKQEIKQIIQQKLTKPRYEHTIRVRDTALILAKKFNVPIEKVTIAALLHDYAKDESEQQLKQKLKFYKISDDLLTFNKELWHGPVGAMTARETFGIKDEAIYNAIYYHTTARACMSDVEKVIYIADYIEPARQ